MSFNIHRYYDYSLWIFKLSCFPETLTFTRWLWATDPGYQVTSTIRQVPATSSSSCPPLTVTYWHSNASVKFLKSSAWVLHLNFQWRHLPLGSLSLPLSSTPARIILPLEAPSTYPSEWCAVLLSPRTWGYHLSHVHLPL